ncbi:DUF6864 domain-containing function [Aeromonas dhakensis]|uniref:DUF6864 domain-containing function n=1 Tax=Aeromonas dhakensis TaxID=196024 RepID=UPI001BFCD1BB|nr:hypothetical protein [Aeromonas dhakensis]HDT5888160.1 hypothetical protein [Aeromonas dhakensis]HDT5890870.1 hypothetical protein [Aeromonas dhakensis]HEB4981027.1 hypothetical protein [Aeromonas dhakensis]HEB4981314.1 hypothetical protein [Aeromonas dhakensis]
MFQVKVTTNNLEVIASGVVHLTTNDVQFQIANLKINLCFKSDSGNGRYEGRIENGELFLDLFNHNNSLGEGRVDPVPIGEVMGRQLFISWYANTVSDNLRQLSYSFMLRV